MIRDVTNVTQPANTEGNQMKNFAKYTVFYIVPGKYRSSTLVYAADKAAAALVVAGKFGGGLAVVTGVVAGEV